MMELATSFANLVAAVLALSVAVIPFFKKHTVGQRTLTPPSYQEVTLAGAKYG